MTIYQDSPLVNGVVPITSGGTGSTTQNFVDLTTAQISINGIKNFNNNVGHSITAPVNNIHVGVASVPGTGGIRLPITSTSPANAGAAIGVNSSGDIVRIGTASFDATIDFSVNANPNTAGTTFSPNNPNSTTFLYVSTIDGSQWTFNGTAYVTQPASADWKTTGNAGTSPTTNFIGTTDAVGFNIKTSNVNRVSIGQGGNVGIGTTTPGTKLELNNGTAGSGLRFTQLTSNSTPVTGALPLGVDSLGNVVATPGNVFLSVSGSNQPSGGGFFTLSMPTVVSAIGFPASNYNTTTSLFTVPITGVYQITGTIRYVDGSPAGNQFGVGVHTSNADGAWFLWHAIQATTNVNRRTSFPYIRVVSLNAGQVLRMYSIVDGPAMNISDVAMQVRFLF